MRRRNLFTLAAGASAVLCAAVCYRVVERDASVFPGAICKKVFMFVEGRPIARSVILTLLLLPVVVSGGCARSKAPSGASLGNRKDGGNLLSDEEARRALVTMVEQTRSDALKMSLRNLKTDPVRRLNEHQIEIGQWHVDLNDATFVVSVIAPPIFEEYQGVFTRPDGGPWEARIEVQTRS